MRREEALEVYKIQHQRFQKSQDLQWKFNIAMWTLISAAIYFIDKREWPHYKYHHQIIGLNICMVLLCLVFVLGHFTFVRLNQHALGVTKAVWEDIITQINDNANQNITVDLDVIRRNFRFRKRDLLWIMFQMNATLTLVAVLLSVYWQVRPRL